MRTWFRLLKARTLLLCSAGVVITGLAPILYVVGLAFVPRFDWAWSMNEVAQSLGKPHVGVISALFGCGIMAAGISGVLRQWALIRIHQERKKDRVLRIDRYRREASRADADDDGRREPFIGESDVGRNTDRRAA
jgi:hypothetical protein